MRWNEKDELRFGSQLAELLARNGEADDLLEQVVGLIEDTLLIYGVPFCATDVPMALRGMARRFSTKRWTDVADRSPLSQSQFFALMIAAIVGMLVNANDANERAGRRL